MTNVAIQLYTLRAAVEQDIKATLKQVKAIGYTGVELAGYGGLSAEEVKEELDRLDLRVAGSHVPLSQLIHELDRVINEQKILENRYVVCPFILPEDRHTDFYKDLVELLAGIKETLNQHELVLVYHNHDFELETIEDTYVLDYLFDHVPGLQMELDVFWLTKANHDPLAWITRHQNHLTHLHLKDMTTDSRRTFAPLGTGGVPLEAILKTAKPLWWIVEQDETEGDPFEAITVSYNYLKKEGVVE